ncbi:hypothetical protein SBA3_690022 [Candidatus Sulfopaludibacter sp. SbA3]|nr:hypothetical protein SBA3_690022 [Candidatus Sulfopaludibacter sp. SbA3]
MQAQATGELHGLVKDATPKVLTGAKVTARTDATAARSMNTDAEGRFAFASVPVGQYAVEVADGFKSYVAAVRGCDTGPRGGSLDPTRAGRIHCSDGVLSQPAPAGIASLEHLCHSMTRVDDF